MLHTSCPDELLAYEYVHGVTGSRTGIFSLEDPHHTVCSGVSIKHCITSYWVPGGSGRVVVIFPLFSGRQNHWTPETRHIILLSQWPVLILGKITQVQCCHSEHLPVLGYHISQWLQTCSLLLNIFSRKGLNAGFMLLGPWEACQGEFLKVWEVFGLPVAAPIRKAWGEIKITAIIAGHVW